MARSPAKTKSPRQAPVTVTVKGETARKLARLANTRTPDQTVAALIDRAYFFEFQRRGR